MKEIFVYILSLPSSLLLCGGIIGALVSIFCQKRDVSLRRVIKIQVVFLLLIPILWVFTINYAMLALAVLYPYLYVSAIAFFWLVWLGFRLFRK
ncbi:hypothetical protein LHT11_13485 [Acetobacter indonesiensis]|uniref:hypothetical protein n=1 Tax=Acetobacter indonesiensis TaxID=104101 RepID=UPI001F42C27A|nr:hypothetical protein [Acetobacter indonesiensis]MCG0996200.1 hypothetical protein [Acetobacter indonesiensis]